MGLGQLQLVPSAWVHGPHVPPGLARGKIPPCCEGLTFPWEKQLGKVPPGPAQPRNVFVWAKILAWSRRFELWGAW